MFKNSKKFKNDNRGSALIVCIIILLFVSILATVILYMSGANYRMKKNELNSTMAFYVAEMPLDRMQSNLLIPVSSALNDSYRVTNSVYGFRGNATERRREFYSQFALAFRDIMIEQYGGNTTIGNSGATIGDAKLIKNIVFNLVKANNIYDDYDTTLEYPRGEYFAPCEVNYDDIFVNNYGGISGPTDPMGFVNTLAGLGKFEGNADGTPRVYICISDAFTGTTAKENYNQFVRLSVTSNPADDPVFLTGVLNEPEECRLLIKNISVVVVENDNMSVINTDIAFQFPPLDWAGGGSTALYESFDPYQLIYYVNWQKN